MDAGCGSALPAPGAPCTGVSADVDPTTDGVGPPQAADRSGCTDGAALAVTPEPRLCAAVAGLFAAVGGVRGLMLVLGMRWTVGSVATVPPPRHELVSAFNQLHMPLHVKKKTTKRNIKHTLTVGARALTKHAHRSSESWWGSMNGSDTTKNLRSQQILDKILDNAVWINVHMLPHDIAIVEVRVAEGYGARWLADGSSFRGFLEPHVADGHENKWRH